MDREDKVTEQLSERGSHSTAARTLLRSERERPDRPCRPVSQEAGCEEGKNKHREADGGSRKPFKDGRDRRTSVCGYKDSDREEASDRTRSGVQNFWCDIFG